MGITALDVRDLEPPEPFRIAMQAIGELGVGDELVLLHRREPFPLYDVLNGLGFAHHVDRLGDDYRIRIRHRSQEPW